MPDIFLSYSREDQATARRFAEAFEREGLSVWWDATLNPGEAFDDVTEKALDDPPSAQQLANRAGLPARRMGAIAVAIGTVLIAGLVSTYAGLGAAAQPVPLEPVGGHEQIYVARSLRLSRAEPTSYCAPERTGFPGATYEDRYTFHSVATRASDGLVTSANAGTIGRLHACVGATPDPLIRNFYAEGNIGKVSLKAIGDCRATRPDFPESGITLSSCSFRLVDLPEGYVGGHLTTSTIRSRKDIGEESDPAGYVQPSIATIRLWKRR